MFTVIHATSGFHQVKADEQASKLLTLTTNMGHFCYSVLPQGICNSSALWNIMTDGDSRIDNERNIVKNMDDFFLYGCDEEELKKT